MRIHVHNILETKKLRRRLRKEETPAEMVLWDALRNRKLSGQKFTSQHSIGSYVADFYCSKHKLAIEADGGIHLRQDVVERDAVRSEYIQAWDINIIRFRNEEILKDLSAVLNEIKKHIK